MLSVVADADDRHLGALHHGNNLLQRDMREGMHPEQCIIHVHVNERCRRKEEASKVIQTTRQSNTAHPRQSLFQS